MKHLQLNTSTLRNPSKIIDFIKSNSIDVACLQEICYPTNSPNPLTNLAANMNYHYLEGVHFYYLPNNQTHGVAVLSKYPILDYVKLYYNSPDYSPKKITTDSLTGTTLIEDVTPSENFNFPGSRGLKHSIKSRCILSALIQTPSGPVRLVTTHFTVSDLCTETVQMYEMSKLIASFISNSKDLPTIFSGDLNIRAESYSVTKISEFMTCHTTDLTDTLSPNHRAKLNDAPNGLAVDHIFSKNLKHITTSLAEIDFSDHQALVSEFAN